MIFALKLLAILIIYISIGCVATATVSRALPDMDFMEEDNRKLSVAAMTFGIVLWPLYLLIVLIYILGRIFSNVGSPWTKFLHWLHGVPLP